MTSLVLPHRAGRSFKAIMRFTSASSLLTLFKILSPTICDAVSTTQGDAHEKPEKFIPLLKPRLSGWLLTAVLLLGTIGLVSPQQLPVVVYKLSLITLAAVLGYWLDRSLFPKARPGQYLKHDDRLMADGRFPVRLAFTWSFLLR